MKKTIIAMAVAAVVSAPLALQAAPTLYGQANMKITSDASVNEGVRISNESSRIGVKGSEDLGNDLKAIYKLEFGVNMKSGGGNLSARDQFVGLSGNFGTVLMGRHQTPLHMTLASGLFDTMGTNNVAIDALGSRVDNVLAYVSPSFGGVTLILAALPSTAVAGAGNSTSLTDITSAAITFGSKSEGLYLSAGIISADMDGADDYTAFSAQYVIAGLTSNIIHRTSGTGPVGGLFQNTSTNTIISFGYEMGDFFPKIRYSMNEETNNSNIEGSVISFGVDYALGKNTTTYIEVDMFDKDFNASREANAADRAAARAAGGTAESHTAISVGLMHKF